MKKRYGFNTPENMINVPASGASLGSDAVEFLKFGRKSDNTFNVDLPNGLYEVKVTLGDTARASVVAEGVYQVINMTGNNATDSFQIPVTDGQLNLLITEGKVGTRFTLSALEIDKLSHHPETFQVKNMASGGQIARGFLYDGQMEAILKYIKPRDYFILQLGINDTNPKNTTTEVQFKEYMRDMVQQVKAKGATPILSTPQGRATDFNTEGIHSSVNRWYRNSIIALAQEENVPLVDLNVLSSAYFTSIGPAASLALYMNGDTLHPNRAGATVVARIVAEELKRQGLDGFTGEEKKNQ